MREFAEATKTSNPDYLDDEQAVIPPTWLIASGFWAPADLANPVTKLNINLARLLHGGQEFVFHGPPPEGGRRDLHRDRGSTRSTRRKASVAAR